MVVGVALGVLEALEGQVGARLGDAERTVRGVYGADRHRYCVMTFREFVAMQEGLLAPDRPPAKGLPRLNPFPTTNAHRRRIKPNSFPPTVRPVAEVVPPHLIPKLAP